MQGGRGEEGRFDIVEGGWLFTALRLVLIGEPLPKRRKFPSVLFVTPFLPLPPLRPSRMKRIMVTPRMMRNCSMDVHVSTDH